VSKAVPGYLGPYRLLSVVHEGHGSRLWRASDERKQTLVAIKTPLETGEGYRSNVRYLKREWEIGRRFRHPRIIEFHEYTSEKGVPYLVLEWYPAPNLKNRIREGFDPLAPMIPTIVLQAAESMAYIHSQGWVHRDIKPENFLVSDSGDLKLIDFALALRKPGRLSRLFNFGGKLQGTRSYMSPEQIRGKPLDERSDVYSLACTLYELVAGRPPFVGTSSNDLLSKHLHSAPPSLETVGRKIDPEFARLIRRAMAKEPEARPKSGKELYHALRGIAVFQGGKLADNE
jgi:serine/threonine protein kinase